MTLRPDPGLLAVRHGIENASNEPITNAGSFDILRGQGGHPSHLRAAFGDASLQAIAAAGAAGGVDLATILESYRAARRTAAAANPKLDAEIGA